MRMAPAPQQSGFLDRLEGLPEPYDPSMRFARIIGGEGADKRPFASIKITKLAEELLDSKTFVDEITIPLNIAPQRFATPRLKRACMWETAVWDDDPLETTYGILPVSNAHDTGIFRATDICSVAYPSPEGKQSKPHGRTAQCPMFVGSLFVVTYLSAHRCVQAAYRIDGFLPLPSPACNQLKNSKIEYIAANATLVDCVYARPDTNNGKPVVWTKDGFTEREQLVATYERALVHHNTHKEYPSSCHMFWMDDTPDIGKQFDSGVKQYRSAQTGDIFAEIRDVRKGAINSPYDRKSPDYTRYQPLSTRVTFSIPKASSRQLSIMVEVKYGGVVTVIEPSPFDHTLAIDYGAEPALFYRATSFEQLYSRIQDGGENSQADVRYLRTHL